MGLAPQVSPGLILLCVNQLIFSLFKAAWIRCLVTCHWKHLAGEYGRLHANPDLTFWKALLVTFRARVQDWGWETLLVCLQVHVGKIKVVFVNYSGDGIWRTGTDTLKRKLLNWDLVLLSDTWFISWRKCCVFTTASRALKKLQKIGHCCIPGRHWD